MVRPRPLAELLSTIQIFIFSLSRIDIGFRSIEIRNQKVIES
jgi:hypothetical protein